MEIRLRQWIVLGLIFSVVLESGAAAESTKACPMQCQPYFSLKSQVKSNPAILTDAAQTCKIPPAHLAVGPGCEAIKITETALKINTRVVTMYTVATVICGVACWLPIASAVCVGSGVISTLGDLQGLSQLQKESKEAIRGLSMMATGLAVAGGVTAATTTVTSTTVRNNNCIAAATYAVVAAAKYVSIPGERKSFDKNCDTVQKESLILSGTTGISTCPETKPGNQGPNREASLSGGAAGSQGAKGAQSGISAGLAELASPPPSDDLQFNEATVASAATAGFDKEFKSKDLQEMYNRASEFGINTGDLENKIASGMSPSDAIASQNLKDFPLDRKDALVKDMKKLEDIALRGKLMEGSVKGSTYASSNQGPRTRPTVRDLVFGMKNPNVEGEAKVDEYVFQSTTKPHLAPVDTGTDEFHPYWTGTIFDLVSMRIELSLDKVEKLEWVKPSNKFIAGENSGAPAPQQQTSPAPAGTQ